MPLGRLIGRTGGQSCPLARARTDADAFAAFYASYATRVLVFFARRVFDADVARWSTRGGCARTR